MSNPRRAEVENTLKQIVRDIRNNSCLVAPRDIEVSLENTLFADLEMDEFELLEMILEIEEQFGIEIFDDEQAQMEQPRYRLGDVADLVFNRLSEWAGVARQ